MSASRLSRRFWRNAAALALITALAAAFRFWRLADVPPGFHFDEAYEALEAWRVLTQPGYHPIFFPGNFGVEPMFIYLTSVAFRLFGESPAVMRGVAALVGTLTVPALFGLGRELALTDQRFPMAAAWLAAISLAVMRWHIIFSRVGIEPILVPLFLVLILWAFWRGMAHRALGRVGWPGRRDRFGRLHLSRRTTAAGGDSAAVSCRIRASSLRRARRCPTPRQRPADRHFCEASSSPA